MHKKMLEHATNEQIKEFARDFISMLKERDYALYKEAECFLYKEIYGCHFNDWMLEEALSEMRNEDGTVGPKWTVEQTTSVAHNNGIKFEHFNEYDWCYVMNMIYSDYYGAVSDETSSYLKLAKKFICDKDAPKGKAYLYYKSMH